MSRLGARRISECVKRRKGLLRKVTDTGSSAVIRCPVGSFCMAVPIYALGSQVATLRAGGFTRRMGASKTRANAVRDLLLLASDEIGRRAASLLCCPEAGSSAIKVALHFLYTNSQNSVRLQDVAKVAGVSRQHLAKIWKKHMGFPLSSCLRGIRIDHAKSLLEAGEKKIIDIAGECGFGSLSQFNRAFLLATGHTPSDWRARHC